MTKLQHPTSLRSTLVALLLVLAASTALASTPVEGEKFPLFEGKTYDGQSVALVDYIGKKAVLIDFWATWCGPCINELPNVKAAYAKYHEMGFEIVGISLDSKEQALRKFYENPETTLAWPSAFDGGGWQSALAKQYDINSIPATFLLDENGVVVATDIRGSKLLREVAKLVDPDNVPEDVESAVARYMNAEGDARREAKAKLIAAAEIAQEEVNALAWTELDEAEPNKERAALWYELMMPTIKAGNNVGALDTAALAAYVMGDAAEAARIQMMALNMVREQLGDSFDETMTRQAGLADFAIREALYLAASGDGMAAKKTYDALAPRIDDLGLADSRYWGWLRARMKKADD
jgi:peroxiredoxin